MAKNNITNEQEEKMRLLDEDEDNRSEYSDDTQMDEINEPPRQRDNVEKKMLKLRDDVDRDTEKEDRPKTREERMAEKKKVADKKAFKKNLRKSYEDKMKNGEEESITLAEKEAYYIHMRDSLKVANVKKGLIYTGIIAASTIAGGIALPAMGTAVSYPTLGLTLKSAFMKFAYASMPEVVPVVLSALGGGVLAGVTEGVSNLLGIHKRPDFNSRSTTGLKKELKEKMVSLEDEIKKEIELGTLENNPNKEMYEELHNDLLVSMKEMTGVRRARHTSVGLFIKGVVDRMKETKLNKWREERAENKRDKLLDIYNKSKDKDEAELTKEEKKAIKYFKNEIQYEKDVELNKSYIEKKCRRMQPTIEEEQAHLKLISRKVKNPALWGAMLALGIGIATGIAVGIATGGIGGIFLGGVVATFTFPIAAFPFMPAMAIEDNTKRKLNEINQLKNVQEGIERGEKVPVKTIAKALESQFSKDVHQKKMQKWMHLEKPEENKTVAQKKLNQTMKRV